MRMQQQLTCSRVNSALMVVVEVRCVELELS